MDDLNNPANWEEIFIQEAIELEEIMKTLDFDSLNKSRLRICLENNILSWPDYERWSMSRLCCASLKMSLTDEDLEKYIELAKEIQETYSSYDFWSEDLIPFVTWDNQLIVLGIQYNEKLVSIENHIFILAPPHLLSYISLRLFNAHKFENEMNEQLNANEELNTSSRSILDGVDFDIAAPDLKFDTSELVSVFTDIKSTNPANTNSSSNGLTQQESLWEIISERHNEYHFEAKKQFDAFIILKIHQNKTNVFKMDEELVSKGVNNLIFEYNLDSSKPFKKVYDSGRSDFFTLTELNMKLDPFQYACITPLKRGQKTIGFFVGFKTDKLSTQDKHLLEELALEIAS